MPHLVEIAFKGNRKEFFLWTGDEPPALNTPFVVEADRGEDVGRVHAIGELAALRAKGCTHGIGGTEPTNKALRPANAEDLKKLAEVRTQDETARRESAQLVRTHNLPMKLTDAEWRWDRRKLTIYFTAEKRVDFRNLVRDLAAKFRTRIELKQIGVRDEARRLDGVGRCGKQYCSASWLPDLRPVNLGLAKDQKLSLNPTQISGACGRLMCCLRYEHDWYVETRRLFPKEGKVVTTSLGEERVVLNDLFRQRVTLRKVADGEMRIIPLAQLNKELNGEPIESDAETDTVPPEEWTDEILSMTDTVERPIPRMLRAPAPAERPVSLQRGARPPAQTGASATAAPEMKREGRPPREERKPREERSAQRDDRGKPRDERASQRDDRGKPRAERADRTERPEHGERRERTERTDGSKRAESKPAGAGPRESPRTNAAPPQPTPATSATAAVPMTPAEPDVDGEIVEAGTEQGEQGEQARSRPRRRRGRRGGRRGGGAAGRPDSAEPTDGGP